MHAITLDSRTLRRGLAVFLASIVLGACGLVGKHASLAAGTRYMAEGQYRAAYIEAKKVLQKNDKDGGAWLLLGQSSLMLGDPKDALNSLAKARTFGVAEEKLAVPTGRGLLVTQQFDEVLKSLPADNTFAAGVKARVAVLRGDAMLALRKPDDARQAYQAALAANAKDPLALVGLAKVAAVANDRAAAGKYVQQALSEAPDNPQALTEKANLAFSARDFATAAADYQKVVDLKHADWLPQERFYAVAQLASAQVQLGHFDKALASIDEMQKMAPQQPYPQYLHALMLYKQGKLTDAVTELQKVLQSAPNNGQAQLLMGAVNYAQDNYGQAEMYLSNVIGMDPKNAEARKMLALAFYREGRTHQALDTLRPIVPGTASDAELLALLARSAGETGKPGVPAAGVAANAQPANPFAKVGAALASGNQAAAIKLLNEMPPDNASTAAQRNSLLVTTYVRENRADEAVKTAAAYVTRHPEDSAAHVAYGTALVAAGKHAEARAQYDTAAKLDPKDNVALLNLGSLDTLEHKYKDAQARYEAILKTDPKNATALTQLGQLAVVQGDAAGAVKWFKQAIDAEPRLPAPYLALVTLYSERGQFEEATATAKQLAKAAPDNPAALNALGATELNAGHHADALQPLQQAVNLAPKVPLYRTNLARAQIMNKDTKDAATNLDEVIKADPAQAAAVALRAFMKFQDHDLPGALALAKTLQQQPANKEAGFALEGDLYMANKSWGEAAKAYQQGLAIKHSRPLVIRSFEALSRSGAKQPEGVLRDWLAKHDDDAAIRLLLAQYYLGRSQNDEAAGQYTRVLKQYPTNIDALNNLAWIYTAQKNPKGLALAEQAYKLASTSPSVADTYGWALVTANQPKTALPILVKAAKDAPKTAEIQYHLAVAQARTGDRDGARSTLAALQKSGADFPEKTAAEKLYAELTPGGAGKQ